MPDLAIFLATSRFSHLTPGEFFGIAFWIGFTLRLIVAESWIHFAQPLPHLLLKHFSLSTPLPLNSRNHF